MTKKKPSKKSSDSNVEAKRMIDQIAARTEGKDERLTDKQIAARLLGSLGGKKGGPARDAALSDRRKKEIARAAAQARWSKKRKNEGQ